MNKNIKKIAFMAAFAMISSYTIGTLLSSDIEANAASDIGGVNRPSHNTGDCTDDGSTYFCENSIIFHDCVKGESI